MTFTITNLQFSFPGQTIVHDDNLKSFLNKVKNQWILNTAILFVSPSL